jgi:hypothetical protein
MAVPELTRNAGIQLNERVSLRRTCAAISLPQSRRIGCGCPCLGHAFFAIRGRRSLQCGGPAQPMQRNGCAALKISGSVNPLTTALKTSNSFCRSMASCCCSVPGGCEKGSPHRRSPDRADPSLVREIRCSVGHLIPCFLGGDHPLASGSRRGTGRSFAMGYASRAN